MKKRSQSFTKLCVASYEYFGFLDSIISWIRSQQERKEQAEQIFERVEALAGGNKGKLKKLPLFEFQVLESTTDNFSLRNKFGQGGFGPGNLQEGQEIDVKRLLSGSGQGLEELVNEVVVISKLLHCRSREDVSL
ncbi:unnamed protein product [Arabis nemorensis]|uniref:Protein kinase domain-containing protein n=1 Tax=Arabis nemorensis TaxID=586526 RepID=A0A565BG63_9BRAS|nr:unnamed protein product [Arabis nemorensis]